MKYLTDSHCHLFFDGLTEDIPALIERSKAAGVHRMICPGINLESSQASMAIADQYPEVFFTAGIHPHDVEDVPEDYLDRLIELLNHPKAVAVGEIGLDYFRNYSDHTIQKNMFREQIDLAIAKNLPIVFHNRASDADVLQILRESGCQRGVAHCFSSDVKTAQTFIEMGFYISFAGNLTYKNSGLIDVARDIPLNRIMVETDSPFLSPVPYRGKPNEPARVNIIAEKLAEFKSCSLEEVAMVTTENVITLFRLKI